MYWLSCICIKINILKVQDVLISNGIITETELNQMYKNAFDYAFVK